MKIDRIDIALFLNRHLECHLSWFFVCFFDSDTAQMISYYFFHVIEKISCEFQLKTLKKVLEGRAWSHTEKSNKRAGSSNWFYCFFSLFCFSWLIAWRTLNFCYKNSIDCYCVVSHILLNFQLLKNKQIQRILANLLENFHVLTHKTATKEYLETRK